MKLKYYLRGLGTGILFATVILFISYAYRMSDKQIKERAKELGMVFPSKEASVEVETTTKEVADESITSEKDSEEVKDDETKESTSDIETEEKATEETSTEEITTEEKTTEETTTEEETTKSDKPVKSYVLTVTSRTISRDVARKLEDAGIIDDAEEFNDYLCENDYASNIQNGKFTVKSNMTYKEIAEIITSKPKED